MRLDRNPAALQFPRVIPITYCFFRLLASIKPVAPTNEIGWNEQDGRIAKLELSSLRTSWAVSALEMYKVELSSSLSNSVARLPRSQQALCVVVLARAFSSLFMGQDWQH